MIHLQLTKIIAFDYYPILLTKSAECQGICTLPQGLKTKTCVIFQVITNDDSDKPQPDYGAKVFASFMKRIKDHWFFPENRLVLDCSLIPDINGALDNIKLLFDAARTRGINVIPGVALNNPIEYLDFVRKFNSTGQYCLRCNVEDVYKPQAIQKLLDDLNTTPDKVIFLLDLQYIEGQFIEHHVQTAISAIRSIQSKNWIDIVVASGSFPSHLGGFDNAQNPQVIPRVEWQLWGRIKHLNVKYADFVTRHPVYNHTNVSGEPTISLKYSLKDSYLIYKGNRASEDILASRQFILHCKELVKSDYYFKESFSASDKEFFKKSRLNETTEGI